MTGLTSFMDPNLPLCCVGDSCFICIICIYLSILVSNTISIWNDWSIDKCFSYVVAYIKWCSCRLTVARRMSLVEQESFRSMPVFSVVLVAQSLVFIVEFCRSLFVLLSFLAHMTHMGVHGSEWCMYFENVFMSFS